MQPSVKRWAVDGDRVFLLKGGGRGGDMPGAGLKRPVYQISAYMLHNTTA